MDIKPEIQNGDLKSGTMGDYPTNLVAGHFVEIQGIELYPIRLRAVQNGFILFDGTDEHVFTKIGELTKYLSKTLRKK